MRVLVLGGVGMLGHRVWLELRDLCDAVVAVRSRPPDVLMSGLFRESQLVVGVDARDPDALAAAFARVRPTAVVNCIGIVKQRHHAKDPVLSVAINSLLPHRLSQLCQVAGARLVHVSTDCVFSGRRGNYVEADEPDAQDLYGRTKLLGEVETGALTLRTSMIGRELQGTSGLVEWFLSQSQSVRGFGRARFSGLSTPVLARVIRDALFVNQALTGVYHVAADPIDKYALLLLLREAFGRSIEIERSDEPVIDRSLVGRRFADATGFVAPSWREMIEQLAVDAPTYTRWRTAYVP